MVGEMVRVVKPGGYILLTCPFLGGLHEEPNDYQRITKYGLVEMFKKNNCKVVRIIAQGSIFSTISMLFNEQLNSFAAEGKLKYAIAVIIYIPLFFFQYLSLLLDLIFKSKTIFFNQLILARKEGV